MKHLHECEGLRIHDNEIRTVQSSDGSVGYGIENIQYGDIISEIKYCPYCGIELEQSTTKL